mmetsp:Transcript_47137/g.87928  ORF Transcript_47137/g.87928 Transcript_47137/m.87928 type:complete len:323 (-) Transcript_47137:3819-4787(-)
MNSQTTQSVLNNGKWTSDANISWDAIGGANRADVEHHSILGKEGAFTCKAQALVQDGEDSQYSCLMPPSSKGEEIQSGDGSNKGINCRDVEFMKHKVLSIRECASTKSLKEAVKEVIHEAIGLESSSLMVLDLLKAILSSIYLHAATQGSISLMEEVFNMFDSIDTQIPPALHMVAIVCAVTARKEHIVRNIASLIDSQALNGIRIDEHNEVMTLLMYAVANDWWTLAEFVLVEGAKVNSKCGANKSRTAMYHAVLNNNVDMVELLMKYDEDAANDWVDTDLTPMQFAAQLGHVAVMKVLVKGHANLNVQGRKKITVLLFLM